MGRTATLRLAERLQHDVDKGVRARGRDYFQRNLVDIDDDGVGWVTATVHGSRVYEVTLDHDAPRRRLKVLCTCPYFLDNWEPCKHVWATILEAQQCNLLSRAVKARTLRLEVDADGIDDLTDPDEYDDAGDDRHESSDGDWRRQLAVASEALRIGAEISRPQGSPDRQIVYILDLEATLERGTLVLEVQARCRTRNGAWGDPRPTPMNRSEVLLLPDPEDRRIIDRLRGADPVQAFIPFAYSHHGQDAIPTRYRLPASMQCQFMEEVCRTGRCLLRHGDGGDQPLTWDDGGPWQSRVEITEEPHGFTITGWLCRGDERMPLDAPAVVSAAGVFVAEGRAAALEGPVTPWLVMMRQTGPMRIPAEGAAELVEAVASHAAPAAIELPPSLRYDESAVTPRPRLTVTRPAHYQWKTRLRAEVSFDYEGEIIAWADRRGGIYQADRRRLMRRDAAVEAAAIQTLHAAGFRDPPLHAGDDHNGALQISCTDMPGAIRSLLAGGWHVRAQGKVYRQPSSVLIEVKTGIDWFDVAGNATFEGQSARLPELIRALRKGDDTVRLDDGSLGVLPEAWLARYAPLGRLGRIEPDAVRFSRSQAGLLDALIEDLPEAQTDEPFEQARRELARFDGVKPAAAPPGFKGALRGYQREGLGWLRFLEQFGFGGCLADDMGLGKTVQILAMLASRRAGRRAAGRAPSLVVVPRSLVFNWIAEARRFAPRLRVLDHTGTQRGRSAEQFDGYDVVVTTYGTLRRDIALLREVHFDYAILDEAQAIKNAGTQSAKAARLLKCDHRVALSGTPIENHLGELWSLFEFLNPGLLGGDRAWSNGDLRNPDEPTRQLLARALRPFILRRTKEQAAPDLPEKVQQTVYCDLSGAERRRYDELRRHYRQSLLPRIADRGMARSTIHVLEALLRLRQAACHAGLLDPDRSADTSAKLEVLLPQLAEVTAEGHKALVFSQFTSLLAIVRQRLDAAGTCYEYLDGRTRKRAARVQRFQDDPDCRVFLISLKAGGLGLNLTAAEYVFLLDPWWNPAVEAQAIDRTHRIGQKRAVFAYRLIARDTVEEKVLELQESKRELADAILGADKSLIRNLTREDLEQLLS